MTSDEAQQALYSDRCWKAGERRCRAEFIIGLEAVNSSLLVYQQFLWPSNSTDGIFVAH